MLRYKHLIFICKSLHEYQRWDYSPTAPTVKGIWLILHSLVADAPNRTHSDTTTTMSVTRKLYKTVKSNVLLWRLTPLCFYSHASKWQQDFNRTIWFFIFFYHWISFNYLICYYFVWKTSGNVDTSRHNESQLKLITYKLDWLKQLAEKQQIFTLKKLETWNLWNVN